MISLKSLMSQEEGRASAASPTTAKSDDLGSWLTDYNRGKGITGAVQGASTSVSNLLSSLKSTTSTSSSTTASASATANPDAAPASSYSSWFTFAPTATASETASLTQNTTTATTTTTTAPSPSNGWLPGLPGLPSLPGYGDDGGGVCFGLSWHQRLALFFMSFGAGVLMLFLSFTFLSLLLLGSAAKFTLSYGAANVCFLLASSFLTGPQAQLTSMFHASRVVVSVLYLASLVALLFAAWQVRVFYVVIPLCIVQVVCLLLYVMSYLPFGLPMMKRLFGVFWASITKMLSS